MKTNNAERKVLKPIKKLTIVLVLIVLLPALIYTAYEFNSLNENEKILSDIYKQQLDAILFSVNQYTWDYINNWIVEFENIYQSSGRDSIYKLLKKENAILMISEIDTTLSQQQIFSEQKESESNYIAQQSLEEIKSHSNLFGKLKNLKKQGYKKIETLLLKDNLQQSEDKILFVFIPDFVSGYDRIVYIVSRSRDFIDIISKKMSQIATDQFKVGIFSSASEIPVYNNEPFRLNEVKQKRNIWIFPDYFLGISLKGASIETILHERFLLSLALIVFVDILMLLGVWLIVRTMKKQLQLTKLKTDFVSNVSHELRTPLALIRMYAETLEMGRIPSDNKKNTYYKIIKQESERLTRLINNILNFSKIESGKKQYTFNKINLNETVNNVLEMYKFHLQNQGFKLNIHLDENVLEINADEEALSEAFINLLDNAIKYSDNKKEITISTGNKNENIFLEVMDSGIGITKENQKYIFDEFYRVSTGSTFTKKGSGLGLSLVKHIVEAHNGDIKVESEIGKGSKFKINFKM